MQTRKRSTTLLPSSPQTETQLLIRGCTLLAPDQQGNLLHNQDIVVTGTHIEAIGESGTLTAHLYQESKVIEGKNRIAIPGFINAHTHSLENILKATSPSLPLELWLVPLFGNTIEWTPRLTYLSTLLGAIEMLKSGTTAVLDHLWTASGVSLEYLNASMRAYRDIGIRAAVAPSIEDQDLVLEAGTKLGLRFPSHPFIDRFDLWPPIEEQIDVLKQWMATWHQTARGRLQCLLGPSGIHWCSPSLMQTCIELAEEYQTGMHLHAVETELQARVIHDTLGQGGIAYLQQLGVLKKGTSLAHAIWLDPDDLARLADTHTTVVHNPVSNLRLGSGRFPLHEALEQGVTVALGSDGSASNDNQNMFSVLKLTGLMHNQPSYDYRNWPQPDDILAAATLGGAASLNMEQHLGIIAPGRLADIVLLDMETSSFLPLRDPYLHLVYCEHGASVDTVIVNGQVVARHGMVTTVDEGAVREEIRDYCRTTWKGFPTQLDDVGNTREVLTTLDTLRKLVLQQA